MAGEFLRVLQRHPLRGIVLLDVERDKVVRAGLGEIDEIVGLVDRIAGPRQVIGTPFQAKRLGYHPARLKQFAGHRVTPEQGLAQPGFGFIAGAGVGRRQPVGGLVDEADDALVGRQLLPVDGIVFVGVNDQGPVRAQPWLRKIRSLRLKRRRHAQRCSERQADKTMRRRTRQNRKLRGTRGYLAGTWLTNCCQLRSSRRERMGSMSKGSGAGWSGKVPSAARLR